MANFFVVDGDNGLQFPNPAAETLIEENLIYECRLVMDGRHMCKNVKSETGYPQEFRPYHLCTGITLKMVQDRVIALGWNARLVPGKFAPPSPVV